jgi:hypothetical protein
METVHVAHAGTIVCLIDATYGAATNLEILNRMRYTGRCTWKRQTEGTGVTDVKTMRRIDDRPN